MVAIKKATVFVSLLIQIILVDFINGGTKKELSEPKMKIDRDHRMFLLRTWMKSVERRHTGRSKRQTRNTRGRSRYSLPYFPLYPMDLPEPFSPPGCQLSEYGCCWNNFPAYGENGHGCPRCKDFYDRLCRLFTEPDFNYCMRPGNKGKFIRYHCFKSCGWCDNFR
ncbi:uncharacterized protein [Porites lutea]|uniref:uncharacterized protein isoform X2 n=1 Tax=Porites lutea TaxID=51062 RepID=UPI003CC536CA